MQKKRPNIKMFYVPGYGAKLESKKFNYFKNHFDKNYENSESNYLYWDMKDDEIVEKLLNIIIKNSSKEDQVVLIGMSTGCNFVQQLFDILVTENRYPKPYILMINPLINLSLIKDKNFEIFKNRNLVDQLHDFKVPAISFSQIWLSENDEVLEFSNLDLEKYNQTIKLQSDHNLTNFNIDKVISLLDEYIYQFI